MNTDRESSLENSKVIYDITKFTHLDYPENLACIVWFSGCNMRCDFCYNKEIVFAKDGVYTYEDLLAFLKTRIGLLDAVVLSGGEASSHNLVELCRDIKSLGFLIKLDTNGINYEKVKKLIELNLLDYVALDFKAPQEKFEKITHSKKYDEFSKTLTLLMSSEVKYEVRTTVHNDLLDENDINSIIKELHTRGYKNSYYLQKFLDTGENIGNISLVNTMFDETLLCKDLEIVWR